eukprot:5114920-Pyramimonas_sp.AAC.1
MLARMLCTVPAIHLLQEIQMLDDKGGSLAMLNKPYKNPFLECARCYEDLLCSEASPLLTLLATQFETAEFSRVSE